MPDTKVTSALAILTQSFMQANIAIPIIFQAVTGIAAIIKSVKGEGPSADELANLIQAQLEQNDAAGHAEVERLKSLLADVPPTPTP